MFLSANGPKAGGGRAVDNVSDRSDRTDSLPGKADHEQLRRR